MTRMMILMMMMKMMMMMTMMMMPHVIIVIVIIVRLLSISTSRSTWPGSTLERERRWRNDRLESLHR